jgi:hypothetical protein
MLTATITFLGTYVLVGVRRLFAGGLAIFTNGTILGIIAERSAAPDHLQASAGLAVLATPTLAILAQAGFVLVTICEVLSLCCLSSPRFRRVWLLVIASFHLLSWPLMQTLFVYNLLLMPVLLMDPYKFLNCRLALTYTSTRRPETRGQP